ncbi:MAG: hypothetical protein C7B43_15010 [Sulfobacillus benefaciens]|uniref:Zinc finger CGNR domain-containing protein n=1 Tax=Sulfobacillus benefaciens TaxID=453960 RepID=A0A2T2WV50_9FIRM|nr:MAG: hypothetical protein C7B43_15010 [Sulfobacillus benefaciens]HBQ96131.1 hypothetical protein [Sulfobacillus sp.]
MRTFSFIIKGGTENDRWYTMKKPAFTNFGDRLVLNFTNTVQYFRGQTVDLIDSPSAVIAWIRYMEEVGEIATVQYERLLGESTWDLPLLGEFRRRLREFLVNNPPDHIQQFSPYLTSVMAHSPLMFTVVPHVESLNFDLVPIPQLGGVPGLLALLSYDSLKMITSETLLRVKKCENPSCLAYFVNNSGKRKWCSMETCGNRRKSFRHYRRYHHRE